MNQDTQESWKSFVGWALVAIVIVVAAQFLGGLIPTGQVAAPFVFAYLVFKTAQLEQEVRGLKKELHELRLDEQETKDA